MNTTGATITHGLDGTLVTPDWPPLTLEEVRGLLRYYPTLGKPLRLLTVSPRPFSAASVVATENGEIFVKRHYCTVRDVEGLREEHLFMDHLRQRGARVARVIPGRSGKTAIRLGEWTYEVHEIPPGIDIYGDAISWTPFRSCEHAYSAGRALAELHMASREFVAPARKPRQLVAGFTIFGARDARQAFDLYVSGRPVLRRYLQARNCREEALALLGPFHAELLPLLPALAPLWTHNDWHASNMMWSDGSVTATPVGVIDFGLADRTNAVHDLAHAIERNMVDWLALLNDPAHPDDIRVHSDHLFGLLEGYESVRPLSGEERLAVAPMTALCHAEFALSETDYFLSVLQSEEKAWYACEGYLVLHARWFSGAGGKLLDDLRGWARKKDQAGQGFGNGMAAR